MSSDRRLAALIGVSVGFMVLLGPMSVLGAGGHGEKGHHHPQEWKFKLPDGNSVKGRAVFVKFDCYFCHEVKGESFPFPAVDYGPELGQMGPLHPLEYFAESVIHPDQWAERKYQYANRKSRMPEVNDRMTVQELIDLSAYLASLRPPDAPRFVEGEGSIIAIVLARNEVVVDHQAIPGFMEAMTMGYKLKSRALLKQIERGDRVRFTLDTKNRLITKIEKLKK